MKFSPDGRYIASGNDGGVAVVRGHHVSYTSNMANRMVRQIHKTGNWMPIGTHQGADMIHALEWHP
ncbi:hypothetical protein L208DRAFT_1270677 [Tricholoma matsutake]|nr:hypothetical protein L208DRAFT_1270677 [Tricholoma matsutake 945]